MRIRVSALLLVTLSLSFTHPIGGQTPSQKPQDDPSIRLRATEVSLDIVVRDKKGKPVKDLTAADFEVYEDGVRQRIESFSLVSRDAAPAAGTTKPKEGVAPRALPGTAPTRDGGMSGVIALVFDRLAPQARSLARNAGMAYAQEGMVKGDYTGVFSIDQALRTVQPFTDNPELVKQAVDTATSAATSTYSSNAGRVRDLSDRSLSLDRTISSQGGAAAASGASRDGGGAAAAGAAIGQAAILQAFAEMETRISENFEMLERDQQGFATINSLLAVISAMRNLPGRKSMIFFSEGLSLPASAMTKFPAVINAANRANVSIYAVDAQGLRVESGTAEAAREINSMAQRRMQQIERGEERVGSAPYIRALERNEDLLRLDPRSGLGQLADQTGGFLIHDTNDLGAGLRRIDSDMRAYYFLTYTPKNEDYNGRFRQISVKLNRPNLEAQTRKGYYALEAAGQLPVLDYEAPALAALRRPGTPAFLMRATALNFPTPTRPGLALLLTEAPISAFTLTTSEEKKTYSSDFSIVALVKDGSGQVVQKLSQHYPLSGPVERVEAARKGEVLFYRETQLPPGRYTVEFIAYDGPTARAAVRKAALEVVSFDGAGPRLSSIAVLKRAERITAEEQKKDQPLHFGELLIYPNLGEPVLKSLAKPLTFYFTAWPAKGATEPLAMTVTVMQNGNRLGQTSGPLPAADDQGRIKYVSSLPLDNIPPGSYELEITVRDSKTSVSRSTRFNVLP